MPKREPSLTLVHENEVLVDCDFCGQPFELDYRNSKCAVEINGSTWVHASCARAFAKRLLNTAKGE